MIDIIDNKIYSYSYGITKKNIAKEMLYQYETYIEEGKIVMNISGKIKISDYEYIPS